MRIEVTDDVGALGSALLSDALTSAAEGEERVVLCLSGGTSPDAVLRQLPGRLPEGVLRKLLVTWTDERVVPYAGPWSSWPQQVNRRSANEAWLSREAVAELPLYPGHGPAEDAAAEVAARWARDELVIDVLLLGFGPDGHIASLFPGHPGLDEQGIVTVITDSPKDPPVRVTLTLPTLRAARRTIGLCTGAEKGRVLRAASVQDDALPLGRYPPSAVEWVIDRAASSALEST